VDAGDRVEMACSPADTSEGLVKRGRANELKLSGICAEICSRGAPEASRAPAQAVLPSFRSDGDRREPEAAIRSTILCRTPSDACGRYVFPFVAANPADAGRFDACVLAAVRKASYERCEGPAGIEHDERIIFI
jgi:hypothetical protein